MIGSESGSGACSRTTWALVPLMPKDETAARRGRPVCGQAVGSRSSLMAPEDQFLQHKKDQQSAQNNAAQRFGARSCLNGVRQDPKEDGAKQRTHRVADEYGDARPAGFEGDRCRDQGTRLFARQRTAPAPRAG